MAFTVTKLEQGVVKVQFTSYGRVKHTELLDRADQEKLASAFSWRPWQGNVLPDGCLVAVIVSPEDVQRVIEDQYERVVTDEQAADYLAEHATEVSDALVQGWYDTLTFIQSLEDFANELPELKEENDEEDDGRGDPGTAGS